MSQAEDTSLGVGELDGEVSNALLHGGASDLLGCTEGALNSCGTAYKAGVLSSLELSDEHWARIRRVFDKLAHGGCVEVAMWHFLQELREDGKRQRLLDLLVPNCSDLGRRTTLGQALEHVQAQALQTVSWEAFRCLVLESPIHRRPSLQELMSARTGSASAPSASASAPARREHDPNEEANRWMECELGVDGAMLRRLYERFVHCQRGRELVRKGDFVRSLQLCEGLKTAFATTPICRQGAPVRPKIWADVLLDLTCHRLDMFTWADVLEVVRWSRDQCLGVAPALAPGPSGRAAQEAGPVVTTAKSRLAKLIVDGASAEQPREEVVEDTSPLVSLDKLPPKHPFLDGHEPAERPQTQGRSREEACTTRRVKVRIRIASDAQDWNEYGLSRERLQQCIAKMVVVR